ncbi:MAG TPA: ergothioneine biosynthesis protein EgtB [Candidatus Fraserbacteria bacterium]|nr:ergothioneine biosynthesis protein EgtB [Candidatus Fraserbacteria bacterium]
MSDHDEYDKARRYPRLSESLAKRYLAIRRQTERLARPLSPEDCLAQSRPTGVSSVKWHLGHTAWFFEVLILDKLPGYKPFNPALLALFNSYYRSVGRPFDRKLRGILSRPSLEQVYRYREQIDRQMLVLLEKTAEHNRLIELGLQHEQQHQQSILRDIKHLFWSNPLRPAYLEQEPPTAHVEREIPPLEWVVFPEGLHWVGHEGEDFAYDNELPRHRQYLEAFQLASRLVTNGEFQAFIEDGGYRRPEFWLDLGWDTLSEEGWRAPLYWQEREGSWWEMTLAGMGPLEAAAPVCHINYFEADAYARWAGARLPSEAEWEVAAQNVPIEGNLLERGLYHPAPLAETGKPGSLLQLFGDVWEWTASPHSPYPGYRPPPGPAGEYNGKFMCNQFVLRGGSCVTPRAHIRVTYRNFYPPQVRLEFSGLRLARDRR